MFEMVAPSDEGARVVSWMMGEELRGDRSDVTVTVVDPWMSDSENEHRWKA